MTVPPRMDPEVAARVFATHLDKTLASNEARREGWTETRLGPLHSVIQMDGVRVDGTRDPYHALLIGDWYDQYPPQARFVSPPAIGTDRSEVANWPEAPPGSPWLPMIISGCMGGSFAFHPVYNFVEDGTTRQLICCSMSFDYYISGHQPTKEQRWTQGRHTVSALLSRLQEALRAPNYQGRSSALDT